MLFIINSADLVLPIYITYKFTHQEHIFDQDRTENFPLAPFPILSLSFGSSDF